MNEAKSIGSKYAARMSVLLKKMDALDTELYELQNELKQVEAPTPVLNNRIQEASDSIKGNVRYVLKQSMDYGHKVVDQLVVYDAEAARIAAIKVPKSKGLVEFIENYNSFGRIDDEDVRVWTLDLIGANLSKSDWFSFDNGKVSRAMAKSVHDRAASDYRTATGGVWQSPYAEHSASTADKVKYGAKYVKELNKYLRPFGVEASPTQMVYFEQLSLKRL